MKTATTMAEQLERARFDRRQRLIEREFKILSHATKYQLDPFDLLLVIVKAVDAGRRVRIEEVWPVAET